MRFFAFPQTYIGTRKYYRIFRTWRRENPVNGHPSVTRIFPRFGPAGRRNLAANGITSDTRIFPHGLTEGRQTAAPCRRDAALPGFSHDFLLPSARKALIHKALHAVPPPEVGENCLPFSPLKRPQKKVESEWNYLKLSP